MTLSAWKLRWHGYVAILSLTAIAAYFILKMLGNTWFLFPLLCTIVIGGIPLLLQIVSGLLKGNLGADVLAAIALVTAILLEEYLAANLLILMLASGQALEYYAKRKASSALLALVGRIPSAAHKKHDSQIIDIKLEEIQIGDTIVIYPHETSPVDGIVIEGNGYMDESYLTGEPYLINKAPGSFVLSGAINGELVLTIRATQLTEDSRYAAIVEVLKQAEKKRPQIRRIGDMIGAIFAPIALIIAFVVWYVTTDSLHFLAVLVIATPCPLLIAIPITIVSAISRAAKRAIIIKDPIVLERLPTCTTAIFDKTGTLTYGKPSLTDIVPANSVNPELILQYVASLERYSKHPLANAVLIKAQELQLELLESSNVSEKPGQGMSGTISGHVVSITSRKKILEAHKEYESTLPPQTLGLECLVLLDGEYAACFRFQDSLRIDSQPFISHLTPAHQFKKIMLVSGDRESEVHYLGELLQLKEIYASQSPEQKLAIVVSETANAPTVFMGDGINDAPALLAATVGIAFGEYSNVTAEAADAVIMENTLSKVDELIHLSIMTRKVALQSAIGGMLFSVVGMGFAAAGFINPVTGAILQEIIDVLAIVNALRLTFGREIKIDLPK